MSSSDINQDLQTYFDEFKKEIEQSTGGNMMTLDDAWKGLSEADEVAEKMLKEEEIEDNENDKNIKTIGKKTLTQVQSNQKSSIMTLKEEYKNNKSIEQENVYDFDNETEICNDRQIIATKKETIHLVADAQSVSNETQSKIHKCPNCDYSANKRFLLLRHIKVHTDERRFKCSVCDRSFKENRALLNHMNSHIGRKPYPCKSCDMRFNTPGELMRHVRYKHTGEKPHKCGECDYSSVELSKMRRHMRCHTGERPYQCPHCTYASPDTFKLKRHLRTHTGEKPYECDICQARFTQSNSLKSHRLIHSVGERPVFQCSLCPTTCGRKTDLQLHVQKLHHSDHPIKCKRCGKELPDRYTYKVHIKTHEGEKCFRCQICPYATVSQSHLDMHMRIHTDEKPFVCNECGMPFRQKQLLMRHFNLYHTEDYAQPTPSEKSHVCPHCQRAFSRKGNLIRHLETHDTESNVEDEKLKLSIGRKIRIKANPPAMLNNETSNNILNNLVNTNTDKDAIVKDNTNLNIIFTDAHDNNENNDTEDDCKFTETFEILEDSVDDADIEHVFEIRTATDGESLLKSTDNTSAQITSQIFNKQNQKINAQHTNIVIIPVQTQSSVASVSSSSKPNDSNLIKIEQASIMDVSANKATTTNIDLDMDIDADMDMDMDDEGNFVVIEVIEDDSVEDGNECGTSTLISDDMCILGL